jgi:chromosome partitioning protein
MKTIAIISRKGGAGKTTLAVLLASAASSAGHKSIIADLDPQRSATLWHNRQKPELAAAEGPAVVPIESVAEPKVWEDGMEWDRPSKEEEIATSITLLVSEAKAKKTDFLVMDTPTNDDLRSTLAAQAADVVLVPCRVASGSMDIDELETTLSLVRSLRKPVYVIPNALSVRGFNEASSEKFGKKGAWVAPHYLTNRAAFAEGIDDWARLDAHDAGKEVQVLYAWLCNVLGMPPCGNTRNVA